MDYYILGAELLNEFLTEIKDELVGYLQTENRNATGRSSRSIQVTDVTNTSGKIVGNSSIEYVFRGRGPGKMPPISAIIDWLNARGLPRGMAWNVARKIAAAGTILHRQGRNVLNEIITDQKIIELKDKILVTFKAQINSEIKSILQVA